MENCTRLKVLPVDVNLSSLKTLNLNGCSNLESFPHISSSTQNLYLDDTVIEEVPCLTEMLQRLVKFSMRGCSRLATFPQLPQSIEELHLDNTPIEEVPCLTEMLPRLVKFSMLPKPPRISSSSSRETSAQIPSVNPEPDLISQPSCSTSEASSAGSASPDISFLRSIFPWIFFP